MFTTWTPLTWTLIGGLALVLVYEITAAIRDRDELPTISQWVWRVSAKNPIVPFAFGVLMGHFFA